MRNKKLESKLNTDIANEWDDISALRYNQLSEIKDSSYEYILKPHIISEIRKFNTLNVIDIGCGTGNLTNEIAIYCNQIVGIDISEKSIEIAEKNKKENTIYYTNDITKFSEGYSLDKFTLAISNMTIMDINDLESTILSVKNLLVCNGVLVFTIPHPCFWPKYKQYENEDWFRYNEEHIIESKFDIASEQSQYKTTHIHRPIETYINRLIKQGFKMEGFFELVPESKNLNKFKSPQEFPRFLAITARISN